MILCKSWQHDNRQITVLFPTEFRDRAEVPAQHMRLPRHHLHNSK